MSKIKLILKHSIKSDINQLYINQLQDYNNAIEANDGSST